ncbi:MAG TPA: DUF3574 domain-containing protein [Rhizomicrobium sp.]|nr:DUF3574 domain-containing protein [Rhizomicrobium sp.]
MQHFFRRAAAMAFGALVLSACTTAPRALHCTAPSNPMQRVELFFGAATNDGTPIPQPAWQAFLDREVTPRFPAGLTAYDAYGQWQGPDGTIEKSPARVLVIWYDKSKDGSARIDAVREAYKIRFQQLSVMRVDSADCVSF